MTGDSEDDEGGIREGKIARLGNRGRGKILRLSVTVFPWNGTGCW